MIDGINVHAESSAGHNIHTVRSKYTVKKARNSNWVQLYL